MSAPKRAFVVNLKTGMVGNCPRFDKEMDANLCVQKCRYCEGQNKSVFFDRMDPKTRKAVTHLRIIHCSYDYHGGER